MAKITKLETQKKDKNRVNLYLDDEFFCGLSMDTVVKHCFAIGQEIDDEHLKNIIYESEKITLFNKCLDYIGSSYKTTKQVRDYLKRKEYDDELIKVTIEKLKEYKILNDDNFAEMYVSTYKNKYGNNMLRKKLFEKGIGKDIVDKYLEENKADEEIVYNLALKKLGQKPATYDNMSKILRFLSGRGWDYDTSNKVIKKIMKDRGEE